MRKVIYSIAVFLVAFVLGLCVAPALKTSAPVAPAIIQQPAAPAMPDPTAPRANADPYIAEFAELPNFEDLSLKDTKPSGRLIDVLERGGKYRKSEVVARNGETWLTLFERDGKYELKSAKASVKQLGTSSYTGDENDAALSFDDPGTPVFAVNNIRLVKSGKIPTLYHRPGSEEMSRRHFDIKPMEDGYIKQFQLNDSVYTLRVANGRTKDGTKAAVLILEHKGVYQILRQVYRGPHDEQPIIGDLLWAGDLDRDGKLDLYFDEFNEKGYFSAELYLSSEAKPNSLVAPVANFFTAGC